MLVRLGVAHHLPSDSYPLALLEQLGLAQEHVSSPELAYERGYRVLWWDRLSIHELPVFPEPVLLITDTAGLGYGETSARGHSFALSLESAGIEKVSFRAKLPVHGGGGGLGLCRDHRDRALEGSGIRWQRYEGGHLLAFPWPLHRYVLGGAWDYRDHRVMGSQEPFIEVGPDFDSGSFRRLFFQLLSHIVCQDMRLPLLYRSWRLSGGPFYSLRLDGDNFCPEGTERTLQVLGDREATWFLRLDSWRQAESIRSLQRAGQSVEVHCFQHMSYRSPLVNRWNLSLAMWLLKRCGVEVEGAVAPFGFYDPAWTAALKSLGLCYSSEFGYAVDDLPSWPRNDRSLALQVPVHPACVGVLRHLEQHQILSHLLGKALATARADGQVLLYDHPSTGVAARPELYGELFGTLEREGFQYLSMGEWARRWMERAALSHEAFWDGSEVRVEEASSSEDFPLVLRPPHGTECQASGLELESAILESLREENFVFRDETERHQERRQLLARRTLTPPAFLALLLWRELGHQGKSLLRGLGRYLGSSGRSGSIENRP